MDKVKKMKYEESKFKYDQLTFEISNIQIQMDKLIGNSVFRYNDDEYIKLIEDISSINSYNLKGKEYECLCLRINNFIEYTNLEIQYFKKYSEAIFEFINMESLLGNDSPDRTLALRKEFKDKEKVSLNRVDIRLTILSELRDCYNLYNNEENTNRLFNIK